MNIVLRVKNLLLAPKKTWLLIREESGDVTSLYTQYLMILALVPVVSEFIDKSLISFKTYRMSLLSGIVHMIVGYVLWLLMIYVMALLADLLAPAFNAQRNPMNALRLIAYSSTPAMMAGIFILLPVPVACISLVASMGSIYLLFLGIPVMMNTPEEKALPYTAILVIGGIVACAIAALPLSLFG